MEGDDRAVGIDLDGAVALEVAHALNGDHGLYALGCTPCRRLHRGEVDIEPGIPVHDEDPVALAPGERLLDGAAGEQGNVLGAVHHVYTAIEVAEVILYLLSAVAIGHYNALNASCRQLVHDEA